SLYYSVAGKCFPCPHQYPIAGSQGFQRHLTFGRSAFLILQTTGTEGHQLSEIAKRHTVAMTRAHLHIPSQQQEEGEHGDGFKIHLTATKDRGPAAGDIRQTNGQRYGDIHHQLAALEAAPGRFEKWPAAEEHHRRGGKKALPAQ